MTLTAKQTRAARHLARGMSYAETARRVGTSARTLHRWEEQLGAFAAIVQDPDVISGEATDLDHLNDLLGSSDPALRLRALELKQKMISQGTAPPDPEPEVPERPPSRTQIILYDPPKPEVVHRPQPTT